MPEMIRVLLVAEAEEDAAAIVSRLQRAGYEVFSLRVDDAEKMKMALDRQGWNAVVSGTVLRRFDWRKALRMAREVDPDVPFILLSDAFSEEEVVQAMKAGASDYLTKDRLPRLPLSLGNALKDAVVRRERRQTARTVEKLQAFREASRRINHLLVRVRDEQELFTHTVEALTEIPGIVFAWIGLVQEGSFVVRPVAQKGFESGYLSTVRITWDDSEYGRGPTGTAIRTGKPSVMRDIREDIRYRPWRDEALRRGYASSIAVPLVCDGKIIGALNLYSVRRDAFDEAEVSFLTEVADDIAVGVRTIRLEKTMAQACGRMRQMLESVLAAFSLSGESSVPGMAGDGRRVASLAEAIARTLGCDSEKTETVWIAGYLHDIGMASVPADISGKAGPLTEEEFSRVRAHTRIGRDILVQAGLPVAVAQAVYQHHERMDGSGYPEGLTGKDIVLEARIIAVADVFVAMTSGRPHRQALSREKAIEELAAGRQVLYDPEAVDACVSIVTQAR